VIDQSFEAGLGWGAILRGNWGDSDYMAVVDVWRLV